MSTNPTSRFEHPVVLGAGPVGRAIVDVLVHVVIGPPSSPDPGRPSTVPTHAGPT